jgi:hypothetical protein
MHVKNVSPLGELYIPALGRDVGHGEVIEVALALGKDLVDRPDWTKATSPQGNEEGQK